MDAENNFIKPVLLFHFSKGKTEDEAYKDISKEYGRYAISLRTINKWFKIFSDEYEHSANLKVSNSRQRYTSEFFTNSDDEYSDSSTNELDEPPICSSLTMSTRMSHISSTSENKVFHKKAPKKNLLKLSDEFIINLVNNNPDLSMAELATLANTSRAYIYKRIKQINSDGERVHYRKKVQLPRHSDEFLIELINDNSNLNMTQLAKLAGISQANMSRRIRRMNSDGVKSNYIKNKTIKVELAKPGKPRKFTDEFLISLVNKNPTLTMTELAKIAGTSIPTISNRLKQINRSGERVKYHKKNSQRGVTKFTDEFLIGLINLNPDITMVELARLANVSQSTISRRLKQINKGEKRAKYIVKGMRNGVMKLSDEFLTELINGNPELNIKQLAELAGTSSSYICRWLKKINSDGVRVKYISKKYLDDGPGPDFRPKTKFTDEFLINLINENPELNIGELAILAGVSKGTISSRLKQINADGERVVYHKKNIQTMAPKFTDEFLIDLINKNPGLTMSELSKLAGTSQGTISNRLRQINSNGEKVKYINKKLSKVC
ncbi:hypothetical protein CONCODRAFT_76853 [Conidiobolus coronatus NRRL 28638]|uniref:Mos1 transposase HTH domain-containing protein n=1 Tax=Conidiobolus coronatus (strain ATCC 28846 / CBS 209.66 / NRRL 28638) TaxID=796925 RepID=A0A137PHI0_CONC2|nr:hypothetical protein CONCODRAFT_76853 [Conidiobolus coronatus NRRL 28638]|eukprot:KXN74466.1 hypothetical protein CONCODRAFT_76853 [Conidiobolus coronatus NRRL 28638]